MLTFLQRVFVLHRAQPVLLVGLDGVGKSDCVVALAALLGKALERVCITGETDSAELVGQLSPATLKWADGPVTKAIRSQAWCLLDNLDAADAVVMVRARVFGCWPFRFGPAYLHVG
jgi:midasin (ATPase involved in ribosome maturation)